ncbi:hypothetical protein [Oceanomicrobium pacificus]|uniref:Ferrochelatase n=1 Tax=Oceanomicrobium pacificus TaxID=2692916 RepID=A0A6B0TKU2_9RHOB|nr:hypothetical protein [Oceanomicrobium pacificus]MXU65140.1 hypothetical protein [Oceanomicrobium pacificus]
MTFRTITLAVALACGLPGLATAQDANPEAEGKTPVAVSAQNLPGSLNESALAGLSIIAAIVLLAASQSNSDSTSGTN